MSDETQSDSGRRVWIGLALAGVIFFLATMFNGWEVPWKSMVLFDCPPIGDGGYVALDPHTYHPGCEYFGPPTNKR